MHPIIYDVAVSLDGFISGVSGDISKFAHEGPVVEDYAARLQTYKHALMGRHTYEFGYAFGLRPGQNPYPHMHTMVVSKTMDVPKEADILVRRHVSASEIREFARNARGPIYLCGGGAFAGWMLEQGLIDQLILKRAPVVLGGGVRLFGAAAPSVGLSRTRTKTYDNGYVLEEFSAN